MPQGIIFDWIGTLCGGIEENNRLFPETKRVLKELSSRYSFSLISLAKNPDERNQEITQTGIRDYFKHIIVATEKNPKQFEECRRIMKTCPWSTYVVDDRTRRGIQIGNQLGFCTIWIKQGKWVHETPNAKTGDPKYTINDIGELTKIL